MLVSCSIQCNCFAEFLMSADAATYDTCTARDDNNVHIQENPAYELVYPMRPNTHVYQE